MKTQTKNNLKSGISIVDAVLSTALVIVLVVMAMVAAVHGHWTEAIFWSIWCLYNREANRRRWNL